MKLLSLLSIASLIISTSCTSVYKTEIWALEREEFRHLQLNPSADLYKFRFDIVRQTTSEMDMVDSICVTESIPYHTLGFALGNGLYFDVNDNLGIDLTEYLDIGPEGFELLISYPGRQRDSRLFLQDNYLCYSKRSIEETNFNKCIRIEAAGDRIAFSRKEKLFATVALDDDTLSLYNRRQKERARIYKTDSGAYAQGVKKARRRYEARDNGIDLDNYALELSENKNELRIYKKRKKRNRLLYYIVKGDNQLFIFNPNYRGAKIEFTDNGMSVYTNGKKLYDVTVAPIEAPSQRLTR